MRSLSLCIAHWGPARKKVQFKEGTAASSRFGSLCNLCTHLVDFSADMLSLDPH